MPEVTDTHLKPLRTWRPMLLWTAGILLALGLAWLVTAVAVPVWQARSALQLIGGSYSPDTVIGGLGGPARAPRKLGLYLRMPRFIAGKKALVIVLLRECGEPAVPVLARTLHRRDLEPGLRLEAARALDGIEEGHRVLADAMHDPDERVRYWAVKASFFVGEDVVVTALLDPEKEIRLAAVFSLERIFSDCGSPVAVDGICRALLDRDPAVRRKAAESLGRHFVRMTKYPAVVPALEKALADEDASVRSAAAEALKKIRGEEPKN